MPFYYVSWCFEAGTKNDAAVGFSTMDDAAIKTDYGDELKPIFRVHNMGSMTGHLLVDAPNAQTVFKMTAHWTLDGCNGIHRPVLDDNDFREIYLGKAPEHKFPPADPNFKVADGEELYFMTCKISAENRKATYEHFSKMTKEEHEKDAGNCRIIGRFSDVASGEVYMLAASKSVKDMHTWMSRWNGVSEMTLEAVVTDKGCQEVIKSLPDYSKRLEALMAKMSTA